MYTQRHDHGPYHNKLGLRLFLQYHILKKQLNLKYMIQFLVLSPFSNQGVGKKLQIKSFLFYLEWRFPAVRFPQKHVRQLF